MMILGGKVWGTRNRDLRGILERLAQKHEVTLSITGIDTGWITKTVEFEAEGPKDALRQFQREAVEKFDR